MRLALHACCGPCLLEPLDALSEVAEKIVVVYANPNIHPLEEYERRRDTLMAYATGLGIPVVESEYDPAAWVEAVGPHARDRAARCRACYRIRFQAVTAWASANGFDSVSTTLSVSPYQDPDAIAEVGSGIASDAGLTFVARDFRDRYAEATRRSRELGMYRQNYCGCVLSRVEAESERAARRAARRSAGEGAS